MRDCLVRTGRIFQKFEVLGSVRGFSNDHGHGGGAAAQVPNACEIFWYAPEEVFKGPRYPEGCEVFHMPLEPQRRAPLARHMNMTEVLGSLHNFPRFEVLGGVLDLRRPEVLGSVRDFPKVT